MHKNTLSYQLCPDCGGDALNLTVYAAMGDAVSEGTISCPSCRTWHRLEKGIAVLLPRGLESAPKRQDFARKHSLPVEESALAGVEDQKLEQMRFFAESCHDYERNVTQSPYYQALDEVYFQDWLKSRVKPGALVCDVGCGSGRQLIPLARAGMRALGVDLSEEMLQLANVRLQEMGLADYVDLIVADAEKPPLKDQVFDALVMIGTLHHVPAPQVVIHHAAQKIKTGGLFFSYDPHESPLRFIFDWLMKVWKLYEEEASSSPLFTEPGLTGWLKAAGIRSRARISTYLPPHFFYFFQHQTNVKLLRIMDQILGHIPIIRKLGGIIIVEGERWGP